MRAQRSPSLVGWGARQKSIMVVPLVVGWLFSSTPLGVKSFTRLSWLCSPDGVATRRGRTPGSDPARSAPTLSRQSAASAIRRSADRHRFRRVGGRPGVGGSGRTRPSPLHPRLTRRDWRVRPCWSVCLPMTGLSRCEARRVGCEAAVIRRPVRLPGIGYVGYTRYEMKLSIGLCDRCNRCNRRIVVPWEGRRLRLRRRSVDRRSASMRR